MTGLLGCQQRQLPLILVKKAKKWKANNEPTDPETPEIKILSMIGRNEREHFKTHG
jgi:hypothetical protein